MFIQLNYILFNHTKPIQSESVASVKNQKVSIQLNIYDTENVTQLNISAFNKAIIRFNAQHIGVH